MHTLEWILEALAAAAFLITIAFFVYLYPKLPAIIPTHFGFSGKADGWGPKSTEFIILGIDVALYALLTIISRFPYIGNLPVEVTPENADRVYRLTRYMLEGMKLTITAGMLFLEWTTLSGAAAKYGSVGFLFLPLFLIGMAASIAVPSALMVKAK